MRKFRVFAREEYPYDRIAIYIMEEDDGKKYCYGTLTRHEVTEGDLIKPAIIFTGHMNEADPSSLKELMNDLWRLGLRPSEHEPHNKLEAVEKHLEDMRSIAFHNLKIKKP